MIETVATIASPRHRVAMFNPAPRVSRVAIAPGHDCIVVDDALQDPDALVAFAARHRALFATAGHNAFPGPELRLPDEFSATLDTCFAQHARAALGARRTLTVYSRFALVTTPPERLAPRQWIPHRDRLGAPADELSAASVLYLFRDERFGGTSFFAPTRGDAETARLVHDSGTDDGAAFTARYGLVAGYPRDATAWFTPLVTIPPRFNRLIFYDGGLFHCSAIPDASALSDDPTRGRLTINGFFTCRRRAT